MTRARAALAALAALAWPRHAPACAAAHPVEVPVQIADESAIIVWDEPSRTEHFIRRATFRTAADDFGFLVPTPAVPALGEVDDAVFVALEDLVKPKVILRPRFDGFEPSGICFLTLGSRSMDDARLEASVRVLASQRVAGYDAVVLEADDAPALAKWLEEHRYAPRPDLTEWLAPYVKARWKITAFRMAPRGAGAPAGAGRVDASAVRMTFATDRPFFPYREPADQRTTVHAALPAGERDRSLHVFFLGPSRVGGAIGGGAPWPGETRWADAVDPGRLAALPLPVAVPAGAWLTAFRDTSSPRPGTDDLFFSPSADEGPVMPPPVVIDDPYRVPILLDVLVFLGLGGWAVYSLRNRLRAR
ncbi:MAG TPA: DUF2330 domain-containing protein [Polyangiaceae bacterium]|nr:DUF2330 domain-containing protein [Polyangiaceae bacterium]